MICIIKSAYTLKRPSLQNQKVSGVMPPNHEVSIQEKFITLHTTEKFYAN